MDTRRLELARQMQTAKKNKDTNAYKSAYNSLLTVTCYSLYIDILQKKYKEDPNASRLTNMKNCDKYFQAIGSSKGFNANLDNFRSLR